MFLLFDSHQPPISDWVKFFGVKMWRELFTRALAPRPRARVNNSRHISLLPLQRLLGVIRPVSLVSRYEAPGNQWRCRTWSENVSSPTRSPFLRTPPTALRRFRELSPRRPHSPHGSKPDRSPVRGGA